MNQLEKSLLNLAIGEFVAIGSFIFAYIQLNLGKASLVSLIYLIIILLQASIYWFYRFTLMRKKQGHRIQIIKLLKFFKGFNILLIIITLVTIFIFKESLKDLIFAIVLFVFGVVEYINYYWYRLSYGKSGFNIKILLNTGLKESSISKLINRYH